VKEKWETSGTEIPDQELLTNARKMCPYCKQEQSQSNLARHIQLHCPINKVRSNRRNEQILLTKKERTKINGESCAAFKHPLPKSLPLKSTKKPGRHLTNKRKVGKGFKSKSKKKDIGSLKLLKTSKMKSIKEKCAREEKRSHRSGSISSNCSSSSISAKSINSGSLEIDSKTLNKLILKQSKKEKMRLNPVQKQLLRRPIMCHLCNFTYSYEDETISRNEIRLKMIEHFEHDHVKKVEKSSLDFNCDFCPYSAPFQLMLTSHLIVQHPEKKPKLT
jgi:hypothetical protein